jgi:hypothetical protein
MLSDRDLPLNDLVKRLLEASRDALGQAVEIEFAVTFSRRGEEPHRFGFLQVRPMMVSEEDIEVSEEDLAGEGVVIASDNALGNGTRDGITDIVFVKPESFDSKFTRQIAGELETLNRAFLQSGRNYLLIGFGRWGSTDPWLGIPVEWGQISCARVIVEATLPEMSPDLSQGSHFFHNMISFGVYYLAVRHGRARQIGWDWLNAQETVREGPFVKWVRAAAPLAIRVDGVRRRGLVKVS